MSEQSQDSEQAAESMDETPSTAEAPQPETAEVEMSVDDAEDALENAQDDLNEARADFEASTGPVDPAPEASTGEVAEVPEAQQSVLAEISQEVAAEQEAPAIPGVEVEEVEVQMVSIPADEYNEMCSRIDIFAKSVIDLGDELQEISEKSIDQFNVIETLTANAKISTERGYRVFDACHMQVNNNTWAQDPHQHGIANGLLIAEAFLKGTDVKPLEKPELYLSELYQNTSQGREDMSKSLRHMVDRFSSQRGLSVDSIIEVLKLAVVDLSD